MILVTGAAGKTGHAAIKALASKNLPVRAWVRRMHQEPGARSAGAQETISGDLQDPIVVARAMLGVEIIYLICPNVHPQEYEISRDLISAAKFARVKKLVYHSVMKPAIEEMPHHWQKHLVEEDLQSSRLDFTILQPASYMQNVLPYLEQIRRTGEFRVPYSIQAQFSPVDLDDIADAAAIVISEIGHEGKVYDLAGPDELTTQQMSDEIGLLLGKHTIAEQQSIESWQESARKNGLAEYAFDALSRMFSYYSRYGFSGNSSGLETLLGRKPTMFREFLQKAIK